MRIPVIAIFDIGKTNKKLLLLNEQYKIVFEEQRSLEETTDEDGDACEDVDKLRSTVLQQLDQVLQHPDFDVKAINVAGYGASFVHIDEKGNSAGPLYSYLKPYPETLHNRFYETYGGVEAFTHRTASPVLGSLNSGMQLYRIKYMQPELFARIRYALHLPQYISYLFTGLPVSEMCSIGCHTNLWDFQHNSYHPWVAAENILEKMAPVFPADYTTILKHDDRSIVAGIGLHDSSAALIPYLLNFQEPFILISTGTWCISMNPFNHSPLTTSELEQDCLNYITYKGLPLKASRLFAGHKHEIQIKRIAAHFKEDEAQYKHMEYDGSIITTLQAVPDNLDFSNRDLSYYQNSTIAYHHLVMELIAQQHISTSLVIGDTVVKRLFVDGGFAKNSIYMHLLALSFPDMEVFAASVSHATAVGAALAIHHAWNTKPVPTDLVELKYYA
ncbi:FGGY family carbohydrate kinase [Chitinophaga sp. MM2321]|uniref:FGGY-family carbohydrate kinase n=1 Tax=Chitinophaga sp. MM2321 TaxID=3137178 RepID=UPI0032D577D2